MTDHHADTDARPAQDRTDAEPAQDHMADPGAPNGQPAEPDAGEGKFASADDFRVPRDGAGERVPVTTTIPGIGEDADERRVKLKPLNYGDVQSYFGDGSVHDVNEDVLSRLFDAHVLVPDLAGLSGHNRGRVTPQDVDEMYPLDPRHLLMALFDISGIDADVMMDGAQGTVEIEGN